MSVTVPAVSPPPSGRPPESNLAPRDVAGLADELVAYHALFAPLFRREEQRQDCRDGGQDEKYADRDRSSSGGVHGCGFLTCCCSNGSCHVGFLSELLSGF